MDSREVFACAELECPSLESGDVANCERERCPFAFQRRREEDAIKDEINGNDTR